MPLPPRAPRRPFLRRHHGDVVDDPYAWMSDRESPDFLAHVTAENAYAEDVTAGLEPLREAIFTEIRTATQETDLSVPVYSRGYWYYTRTVEGRQYGIQARIPGTPDHRPDLTGPPEAAPDSAPDSAPRGVPQGEQILLDGDAEAAGSAYFSLGACEVPRDDPLVAVAIDRSGDERFDVSVRDIATGAVLDDAVTDVGYGIVWTLDARAFFYTRLDEAWRPHEVWRHTVGRPASEDVLVFEEADERFWLGIGVSRDDRWLVLALGTKTTSEAHLLDLADPDARLRCVRPREQGVEYDVEPADDHLLVVHNRHNRDFSLALAPLPGKPSAMASGVAPSEGDATGDDPWVPLAEAGPGERFVGVDAFADYAVLSLRAGGLTGVRILPRTAAGTGYGAPWDLSVDEELYTLAVGSNPEWETRSLQVGLESFVRPRTVAEFDLVTGAMSVLKTTEVIGYDPGELTQRRVWVTAADGVSIPLSIVAHATAGVAPDGAPDADAEGAAARPGVLYGYGAYEVSLDPWFSIPRLSLLRRGVVYAVAHVRGGGEMGRGWYEAGRMEHKATSFTDLDACAAHLLESGIVARDRLGLTGASAGGLLVGAALNLAPERYRVVHADVPFVDALTTMLDPSLPLTVAEWEEWGNPLEDAAAYARMKAYTPYENIRVGPDRVPYPAILATASLHDTRVFLTEPAKWVARLRDAVTGDAAGAEPALPILLRAEMEAGHAGRSGRYDAWRQSAWELAFLLHHLGAETLPGVR